MIGIDSAAFEAARDQRSAEAWRRFEAACRAAGVVAPPDPGSAKLRFLIVRHWRRRYGLDYALGSGLEAGDLGEDEYSGRPPAEACPAPPGTSERVLCYAARLERGEELWCAEDFRDRG